MTIILFLDSPISQTYKETNSIIAAPLHQQVNVSITVIANPANVSFQWYFKPKNSDWMMINSTDDRFSVRNTGLRSVLIVKNFELELQGKYRVNVYNSITDIKMFNYSLRPGGK